MEILAQDLFRQAYENRYTWDKQFPGYNAKVEVIKNDRAFTGTVQINADLSASISDIDDQSIHDSVKDLLRELAIHRIRRKG